MLNPEQPLTMSGVDYVEVSLEGGPFFRATGTTNWTFTFNNVLQGLRTVRVRARDKAGNMSAEKAQAFTVQLPGNAIVVTPSNFRSILTNIGRVDFTGSNSSYIQVNRGPDDHNMLAIPCTFENLEVEAEVMYYAGNPSTTANKICQWQTRTWHHGDQYMCDGRAYKAAFGPTSSSNVKEMFHRANNPETPSGYCIPDKASVVKSYANLKGRFARLMFRTRNLSNNDVLLENYVDGVKVCETVDRGDWPWLKKPWSNAPVCYSVEKGNTGNRKVNERLNKRGEWVLFRSDGDTTLRYKSLIVRQI